MSLFNYKLSTPLFSYKLSGSAKKSDFLSDVRIICGRKAFDAHKFVLAQCRTFKNMEKFSSDPVTTLDLTGHDTQAVEMFLEVLYTGTYPDATEASKSGVTKYGTHLPTGLTGHSMAEIEDMLRTVSERNFVLGFWSLPIVTLLEMEPTTSYDPIKEVIRSVHLAARVNTIATKMDASVAKLTAQARLLSLIKAIYQAKDLTEMSKHRLHNAIVAAVVEVYERTEPVDPLRVAVIKQVGKGAAGDDDAMEYVKEASEKCPAFARDMQSFLGM